MARSRGSRWVMSRSPRRIEPSSTVSRPAIIRNKVVLPQPEGPTSTMNSPSLIVRLMPSTALTPPGNVLLTPLKTISLTGAWRSAAEIAQRRRQVQLARGPSDGDPVHAGDGGPVAQFGVPPREGARGKPEAHVLLCARVEREAAEILQLPERTPRAVGTDVELDDRLAATATGVPHAHRSLAVALLPD